MPPEEVGGMTNNVDPDLTASTLFSIWSALFLHSILYGKLLCQNFNVSANL